jgi:archaellum component FlaF (FlaF/FlaG flagellin family)
VKAARLLKITVTALALTALVFAESVTYVAKDRISVQGKANRNVKIEVFVNNRKAVESKTNERGEWVAYNIPLQANARNDIYAVAISADGVRSNTSTKLTVFSDITVPHFYNVNLSPNTIKPGESTRITARTGENITSVKAVMPDNSAVELLQNLAGGTEGDWTAEWRSPKLITGGVYKIPLTAVNRAGTVGQSSQAELNIDAKLALSITAPEEGALVYDNVLTVTGRAQNSSTVALGADPLLVGGDGLFSGNFTIPKAGRNQITVTARDAAGGQTAQTVNIVKLITFPDIQNHWARREIEYLATLGYLTAYQTGFFVPDNTISRGEMATILVRATKTPATQFSNYTSSSFHDVPKNYWALGYIESAHKSGLVIGYPRKFYRPTNTITRAEAIMTLMRLANVPPAAVYGPVDIDVPETHWAAGYISAFKTSGLMPSAWQGQQRFYPNQPITRAEVAAILARTGKINAEIETLLGAKTAWTQTIVQPSVASPISSADGNAVDGSAVIMAVVSPRDALPDNDVIITVVSMQRLRHVGVFLPDNTELLLQYNPSADLWEGSWRVSNALPSGTYQLAIRAMAENSTVFTTKTSPFVVTNAKHLTGADIPASAQKSFPEQGTTVFSGEYVYPPAGAAQPPAGKTEQSGYVYPPNSPVKQSGANLTRSAAAVVLAKYGYLRQAKVSAPPAKDVALSHPQVGVIKSAIVTGIIPNKAPQTFKPDDEVSYAEAAEILRKAKISARVPSQSGSISAAEFEQLVSRR